MEQLTEKAVQKFQEKHNIVSSGTPETTGYGRVGPKTLAKLNEVFAGNTKSMGMTSTISAETPATPSTVSAIFVSNMAAGSRSEGVKSLQILLNSDPETKISDSGVGSPGSESTYFGALTVRAVEKFQMKYGIAGPGEAGYGRVGPKTRAKLEEIFDGAPHGVIPPPIIPSNPNSTTTDAAQAIQQQIDALLAQVQSLTEQVATVQTGQ